MKKIFLFIFVVISILKFISCSATPVDDRYKRMETKEEKSKEKIEEYVFDFSPYQEKLDSTNVINNGNDEDLNLWLTYKDDNVKKNNEELKLEKTKGYRVQVFVSDNWNEADTKRSEIYFKSKEKNIYIDFEPPFYKVKVGDFIDINAARELSQKLNQLGYEGTAIVPDSVNIYR